MTKQYPVSLEIAGKSAMWSRPDCGDSPCSYVAPTYSAVKGIFEAVLWGPATLVIPRKVELCSVPHFRSYVTNYGGPLRSSNSIKHDNNYQFYATILTDVCYRLYADVIPNPDKDMLTEKAKAWDANTTSPGHAYQAIFRRRLERGQYYTTPFLGWREFTPSYFGPFRESTRVCDQLADIKIPSMLRCVFRNGHDSCKDIVPVYDTDLCVHKGTLIFPQRSDCL